MTSKDCRHLEQDGRWCSARKIMRPDHACVGCEMYEPSGTGLGDVVEKVIDTVTLGMAKKAVEKSGKDCGCKKRRAALNRIGRTDKKSD